MAELRIEQDALRDTVTINGIVYARMIFEDFAAAMPTGQAFRIVSRNNNVLTIECLPADPVVQADRPTHGGRPMTLRECMEAEESTPHDYAGAFYEMAAQLGIQGARPDSPERVYAEQIKPALEKLIADRAHLQDAYTNMRDWAEQNGLDTATRNSNISVGTNSVLTGSTGGVQKDGGTNK